MFRSRNNKLIGIHATTVQYSTVQYSTVQYSTIDRKLQINVYTLNDCTTCSATPTYKLIIVFIVVDNGLTLWRSIF
jgi:hypothetical protein